MDSSNVSDKENTICHTVCDGSRDAREKTRIPQQERGIKTRNQIIDASMRLFSKKGYHNTNSKEIAAEAGVATGCFYSYFLDKREVFIEALKKYNSIFNDVLKENITRTSEFQKDKKEYLSGIINAMLEAHKMYSEFHNELVAMKFSDQEVWNIMYGQRMKNVQLTLEYLQHFQNDVKIGDLEAAAVVIVESMCNIVDSIVFLKNDINKERIINETVDMIIKYLFY